MSGNDDRMAYVFTHDCGGWTMIIGDDKRSLRENADDITACLVDGNKIHHVTSEDVRSGMFKMCECQG